MTILTMTFLGLEARADLPKVPYPTALDFFVLLSFGFIFATIVQFALVHYFTKYGYGECYFSPEYISESSSDEDGEWDTTHSLDSAGDVRNKSSTSAPSNRRPTNYSTSQNGDSRHLEVIPLSACTISGRTVGHRDSWTTSGLPSCLGCKGSPTNSLNTVNPSTYSRPQTPQRRKNSSTTAPSRSKRRTHAPRFNSVSKIDRASRIFFPLCFLIINLTYWYAYLLRSERIHKSL